MTNEPARPATVDATVRPANGLNLLSRREVAQLRETAASELHALLRQCALAVLTQGNPRDDARELLAGYPDFDLRIVQQDRGVRIELEKAPAQAFVDGDIITGVGELLFAVVRDVVYTANKVLLGRFDFSDSGGCTDAVFRILRNAEVLSPNGEPNLVVCWGGHSVSREEYDYTKRVGYELGLRRYDICTGCGPGAMKGPMKGAAIAHAKQRNHRNRYIGITEPGIIASESPNPIVNHLVIMPDIEKRLEAFVRLGHAIIVFPGGVGTAEEILYLLGILLHPANAGHELPLILTGPAVARDYFAQIDRFLRLALGDGVARLYRIVIDDALGVARAVQRGIAQVREQRLADKDAFYFNWGLDIPSGFQQPFQPTHEAMAALNLHRAQPVHELAANLRRAFSGIVAGNVREEGRRAIEQHGPFVIDGDPDIMQALDALLASFVEQQRMKLPGARYEPCYRIRTDGPARVREPVA